MRGDAIDDVRKAGIPMAAVTFDIQSHGESVIYLVHDERFKLDQAVKALYIQ